MARRDIGVHVRNCKKHNLWKYTAVQVETELRAKNRGRPNGERFSWIRCGNYYHITRDAKGVWPRKGKKRRRKRRTGRARVPRGRKVSARMRELQRRAKGLAVRATKSEKILLRALERKGIYYRFQHVMEPYIVDFFFPQWAIVVEVDGAGHSQPAAREKDARRTRSLKRNRGVKMVLWFSNQYEAESYEDAIREIQEEGERIVEETQGEGLAAPLLPLVRDGMVIQPT